MTPPAPQSSGTWLRGLRTYLGFITVWNLIWESFQLPLYTVWSTGTARAQVVAVLHCTIGDLLIALSALIFALLIVGDETWPSNRYWPVAALALIFGIAYTAFSEWLNVTIRASWDYSEWMPVISVPGLRIGVSPLLQWFVVPIAAFAITRGR